MQITDKETDILVEKIVQRIEKFLEIGEIARMVVHVLKEENPELLRGIMPDRKEVEGESPASDCPEEN